MDERQAVARAIEMSRESGSNVVLATLVRVLGSGFRDPGSRMLVDADGARVGDLSGGCLDGDVATRAQALAASGPGAELLVYDGDQIADLAGGFGVGCPRRIEVLLQSVGSQGSFPAEALLNLQAARRGGWLAVVCAVDADPDGQIAVQVGQHFLLADGDVEESSAIVRRAALLAQIEDTRPAAYVTLTVPGGRARLFVERIDPAPRLLLLGGTTLVQPLVRFARELGWDVVAFQCRLDRDPPSDGIAVRYIEPPQLHEVVRLDPLTMVVVMEHHQARDLAWIEQVLESPVPYIGVLGSRKRVTRMLEALGDANGLPARHRDRLHGPIGLELGSKTPAQIALAIVAEVQGVLAGASMRPKREGIDALRARRAEAP